MPPEVLHARINVRIAELRLLAAKQFARALLGNRRLALSVAPDATHILLDVCALPEAVVFKVKIPDEMISKTSTQLCRN
jgi:hypothetical protein